MVLCSGQAPEGNAPEALLALWVARLTGRRSWRGGWEAERRRELWTPEGQENISSATEEEANPSAPPGGPPVDRFLLVAFRTSSQVRKEKTHSCKYCIVGRSMYEKHIFCFEGFDRPLSQERDCSPKVWEKSKKFPRIPAWYASSSRAVSSRGSYSERLQSIDSFPDSLRASACGPFASLTTHLKVFPQHHTSKFSEKSRSLKNIYIWNLLSCTSFLCSPIEGT